MSAPSEEPITFSPLIADILTATISMTHDTTSRLIDSLTEQVEYARAREAAVEVGIVDLLSGDFMPTTAAIMRRLYPSEQMIESFRDRSTS